MNITLETYEQNNLYIELFWNKNTPNYHCFVGKKYNNSLVSTIKDLTYTTKEQANRSFKHQIAKAKKGEI